MDYKEYNKKAFLLPNSIRSMAAYHAKLYPTGRYVFHIHDCHTGIRLTGQLDSREDFVEACEKAKALAAGLVRFSMHIEMLMRNEFSHELPPDSSGGSHELPPALAGGKGGNK